MMEAIMKIPGWPVLAALAGLAAGWLLGETVYLLLSALRRNRRCLKTGK